MAAWVLVHQYRLRAILRRSLLLRPRGVSFSPVSLLGGKSINRTHTQTTYHRQVPTIQTKKRNQDEDEGASDKESIEKHSRSPGDVEIHNVPSPEPPTFLSQLKIYNGTFTDESVWKIFLRPFPLILSPVVRTAYGHFLVRHYLILFWCHLTDVVHLPGLRDANGVAECVPTMSAALSVGGGPLTLIQVWFPCARRPSSPSSMTLMQLKLCVFRARNHIPSSPFGNNS